MQKTANQIKSSFELLASGHYQIHSFLYAQEFEQQAYENLIYPLMLVYPLGGNLSGTTYSRNYRVIIADRVLKSEGNELEVESDTQLIALDVLAYWMKMGQNERFAITSSNTITPFWEKWGDEVTGHFVDIGIEEFYDFNSCAIPLSGSIPIPPNPCKDARISVNSVVYGNAPSDSNFNVVVKNQSGALVGSLIGGEWIVNTGSGCLDSTYTITNSLGATLYTGTIPSGGSLTQAISNSTLNVNKSDGTLISSRSILAQGTSSYNVADSVAVINNSAGTTLKTENILATASENITINDSNVENSDATYSANVLAEGSLVLPNSQINVNSVDSGDVVSVKTIDVNLENSLGAPVNPTSVGLVGNTLTIEVPSGGVTMEADFSADILVAKVGETITFTDLTDNSPTDWAWDFNGKGKSFLQNPTFEFDSLGFKDVTLIAAKDGAGDTITKSSYIEVVQDPIITNFLSATSISDATIISALTKLVYDLRVNNLLSKFTAVYPFVGGTATTHKFNLLNPADTNAAYRLVFSGGWTHSSLGVKPNGTNASADTFLAPNVFGQNNIHASVYIFSNLIQGLSVDLAAGGNFYFSADYVGGGLGLICNINNTGTKSVSTVGAALSGFYVATRLSSTERVVYKNGNLLDTFTATSNTPTSTSIKLANNSGAEWSPRGQSFTSFGTALTSGESLLLNTIVSDFQQTLGRRL